MSRTGIIFSFMATVSFVLWVIAAFVSADFFWFAHIWKHTNQDMALRICVLTMFGGGNVAAAILGYEASK